MSNGILVSSICIKLIVSGFGNLVYEISTSLISHRDMQFGHELIVSA